MSNHIVMFDPTLTTTREQPRHLIDRDFDYQSAPERVERTIVAAIRSVKSDPVNSDPTLKAFYEPIPTEGHDG